jgi:hypothetical protein
MATAWMNSTRSSKMPSARAPSARLLCRARCAEVVPRSCFSAARSTAAFGTPAAWLLRSHSPRPACRASFISLDSSPLRAAMAFAPYALIASANSPSFMSWPTWAGSANISSSSAEVSGMVIVT